MQRPQADRHLPKGRQRRQMTPPQGRNGLLPPRSDPRFGHCTQICRPKHPIIPGCRWQVHLLHFMHCHDWVATVAKACNTEMSHAMSLCMVFTPQINGASFKSLAECCAIDMNVGNHREPKMRIKRSSGRSCITLVCCSPQSTLACPAMSRCCMMGSL